jgi:hypothetical protein
VGIYRIGARVGGATALTPLCNLLNPDSSSNILRVMEFSVVGANTGSGIAAGVSDKLKGTTSAGRGTPFASFFPDIDNDVEGLLAPPSNAILDIGPYSTNPTVGSFVGNYEWMDIDPTGQIGQGFILRLDPPKQLEPGEGLSFLQGFGSPNWPGCDVTYVWEE